MNSGMLETTRFVSSGIGDGDREGLETGLSQVEGVREVKVDAASHSVSVRYDPTVVDKNSIRAKVEDLGFSISDTSDHATEGGAPPTTGQMRP